MTPPQVHSATPGAAIIGGGAPAPSGDSPPQADLIRILVVDDHTTFAELLTGALDREADLRSVGCSSTVESGVEKALLLRPDVIVMDFQLPDGDGLTAAERILAEAPATRIVLLTGNATGEALERAAAIGVCAFLPKDGSLSTVLDTVRHARNGGIVVHPSVIAQAGARRFSAAHSSGQVQGRSADLSPILTRRELEVLKLMTSGTDVRTSANVLGISQNTCRGHVKAILAKLGAHTQLEAVVKATRLGLLASHGSA
jgi:DNA-binding NarL/FixJ family response regulator